MKAIAIRVEATWILPYYPILHWPPEGHNPDPSSDAPHAFQRAWIRLPGERNHEASLLDAMSQRVMGEVQVGSFVGHMCEGESMIKILAGHR